MMCGPYKLMQAFISMNFFYVSLYVLVFCKMHIFHIDRRWCKNLRLVVMLAVIVLPW